VEHVVVNAAGCGSSMKAYGQLLADDPVYADRAGRFAASVRDVSGHLGHAQGVRAQPRELLREIPGLELREIADPEICCGSAGIYNILNPEPARDLGDRKARDVLATGAELLVTANPGCLMQVASSVERLGGRIALAHTVEVLDASLRGLTPPASWHHPSPPKEA
jgi:glycolate oxidase iron-sulfur subunit